MKLDENMFVNKKYLTPTFSCSNIPKDADECR